MGTGDYEESVRRPKTMKTTIALRLIVAALGMWITCPQSSAQRIIIDGGSAKKKEVMLDPIFAPGKLWSYTPDSIEKEWTDKGFKWASKENKDRGMLRREKWGFETLQLNLFSSTQTVEEVVFLFKDGKCSEAQIAIWNKGDSEKPEINQKEFTEIVQRFVSELNARVAKNFQNLGKDMKSAAKAERLQWVGTETLALLEYSGGKEKLRDPFTGREKTGVNFQGEFIRLRLIPKPASLVGGVAATSTGGSAQIAKSDLSRKLQKDPNGDVFIPNIPMVDQGDKGYCAVATAARVLNYYGIPADQHEMAQVSGNEAGGGGTNPDEMEAALKKLQGKYHISYREVIDTDYSSSKYKRFLDQYNRVAKRLGKRVLDTDNYIYFMGGLDAEVLREVRGKGQTFDKFMKAVRENIDGGVPLLWGLHLGKYPENGEKAKQFGGGHMRLIIGYNLAKGEIIFSDSWGAGHEKKRMASADASAATMGLYTIKPSQ
jgi:hypothetical protein